MLKCCAQVGMLKPRAGIPGLSQGSSFGSRIQRKHGLWIKIDVRFGMEHNLFCSKKQAKPLPRTGEFCSKNVDSNRLFFNLFFDCFVTFLSFACLFVGLVFLLGRAFKFPSSDLSIQIPLNLLRGS